MSDYFTIDWAAEGLFWGSPDGEVTPKKQCKTCKGKKYIELLTSFYLCDECSTGEGPLSRKELDENPEFIKFK